MKFTKEEIEEFESTLGDLGYRKMKGHYRNEDYAWWKSFDITYDSYGDKKVGYQIALLVFDFSKYPNFTDSYIGVQFEMITSENKVSRVDLSLSDDNMTVTEFEDFCADMYSHINNFFSQDSIRDRKIKRINANG
jgi:hypothetical protein